MNSRFMLVGTPSGISLAPEGGAHQSIGTPLIGASVPNLLTFEPAFADEVKLCMRAGFEHMQVWKQTRTDPRTHRTIAEPPRHRHVARRITSMAMMTVTT